jgi:uncharacterized circularly permuted ATP-grasp superfamily protein
VPRIIPAGEWQNIAAGVSQRVRALEAFLADVYSLGQVHRDGVVPREMVATSHHFHRASSGIEPPNGVRIHVSGVDLVRDATGSYRVLEDNLRCPSGISYVIENRRAMAHVFPDLLGRHHVHPVAGYPSRLLEALRSAAPTSASDASVVVLTPGVNNSAYFEHTFLARQMGVELVEGRDLTCRNNKVYVRSTRGLSRVDVIYRRIDDDFIDPLHFRPDSLIGCPGLLNAARAGNVTLANAVGNGIADDKAIYPYVPDLIAYYLGEKPILGNVRTYKLTDPSDLGLVLDHLPELVCKPADGSGGHGLVVGPASSEKDLRILADRIRRDPRAWIAQDFIELSTLPTWIGNRLAPRKIDLRPFAINDGRDIYVLPGGLTRVALPEGSTVVNSSQGGGSKDTWVLAATGDQLSGRMAGPTAVPTLVPSGQPLRLANMTPGPSTGLDSTDQQQQ